MDVWNFVASVGASYLAKWFRNSESNEECLPPSCDGGFGSEVSSDFMLRNNCCGDFWLRRGAWKFGKQRGFLCRRRDLRAVAAAKKPVFSVESCLIAQIGGDGGDFEKVFSTSYLTFPVSSQTGHISVTAGNRIVSRRGVSLQLLEFLCGGKGNAGLTQTNSDLPNNRERFEHGCLLFSFGVVNGMILTIMSSRREIERLRHLLSQTEALAQGLKEELEMRTSLTVKELSDEAYDCLETGRNLLNEEHGQRAAASDWKTTSVHKVEDMTSIEAELETELEKLELNLHISKHQTTFLRINEIDPDCVADVVNGELRQDGLMHNAESEADNSTSTKTSTNEAYKGNYTVSPRDLERHLHDVLQRRLQERIIELEAELEASQNKLQGIELAQWQSKK